METIKIICHNCNAISTGINNCDKCDHDLKEIRLLYITALSGYNRSIKLIEQKNIIKAWGIIKEQLNICPFLVDLLQLGYLLALENGDYEYASRILNQLKSIFSEDEYQLELNNLRYHIERYNQIVNNELDYDDLDHRNYSLYHLTVLYKKCKPAIKKRILDQIEKIDPSLSSSLGINLGANFKMFKIPLYSMLIIFSGILFIFYNNNNIIKKDNNQINVKVNSLEKINRDLEKTNIHVLRLIETIQDKDYVESIEILRTNEKSHFLPENINFFIEDLPNAFYYLYLQKKKASDRQERIEEFINLFPNYHHYTAPLLEEIIKYYGSKSNEQKAYNYAVLLDKHVEYYPENNIYLNSYVKNILQKGK